MILPKLVHDIIMYYRIKDGSTVYQEIVKWCGSKIEYESDFSYHYDKKYDEMMDKFKTYLAERVEGNKIYFNHISIECNYRIESHAGCMTTQHFYFFHDKKYYGYRNMSLWQNWFDYNK